MNNTCSASVLGILRKPRRARERMSSASAPLHPKVGAIAKPPEFRRGEERDAPGGRSVRSGNHARGVLFLGALERAPAAGGGQSGSTSPKKRGLKPDRSPRQVEQVNRENARLRRELERAEIIIDAQQAITHDAVFAAHPIHFKGIAPKSPGIAFRRLGQSAKKRRRHPPPHPLVR
jgi:hypothetical protein